MKQARKPDRKRSLYTPRSFIVSRETESISTTKISISLSLFPRVSLDSPKTWLNFRFTARIVFFSFFFCRERAERTDEILHERPPDARCASSILCSGFSLFHPFSLAPLFARFFHTHPFAKRTHVLVHTHTHTQHRFFSFSFFFFFFAHHLHARSLKDLLITVSSIN